MARDGEEENLGGSQETAVTLLSSLMPQPSWRAIIFSLRPASNLHGLGRSIYDVDSDDRAFYGDF